MNKQRMKKLLIILGVIPLLFGILYVHVAAEDDLDRGMIVYQANCLHCHGENGDGNGPEASNFVPGPADLTSIEMASVPDSHLEKAIVEGVSEVEMHSWGGILSKEDIYAVIKFVRSFQQ